MTHCQSYSQCHPAIIGGVLDPTKLDDFNISITAQMAMHNDVIEWKYFPRYWPFVRGIQRWPVNSPHKGQWLRALMFSLICTWINGWVNNPEAGDLRRHQAHYDVIVMVRNSVFIRFSVSSVHQLERCTTRPWILYYQSRSYCTAAMICDKFICGVIRQTWM